MLNWLPIFAASSVSFLLSCSTPVLLRSCVYRILPEKPTRSVFLFADIFLPPLGSAESWHVVRGRLRPQCWLGSQHSGQCSSHDINHGENETTDWCWHEIRRWTCFLFSPAMSSSSPFLTAWEKRVWWVLCLNSCSSLSRYQLFAFHYAPSLAHLFYVPLEEFRLSVCMFTDGQRWTRAEFGLPRLCKEHSSFPANDSSKLAFGVRQQQVSEPQSSQLFLFVNHNSYNSYFHS